MTDYPPSVLEVDLTAWQWSLLEQGFFPTGKDGIHNYDIVQVSGVA